MRIDAVGEQLLDRGQCPGSFVGKRAAEPLGSLVRASGTDRRVRELGQVALRLRCDPLERRERLVRNRERVYGATLVFGP